VNSLPHAVPAALLAELLLNGQRTGDVPAVHHRGVQVQGAQITGQLDLRHGQSPVPLILNGRVLRAPLQLQCAVLPALTSNIARFLEGWTRTRFASTMT
jgi:hypothetical protein